MSDLLVVTGVVSTVHTESRAAGTALAKAFSDAENRA